MGQCDILRNFFKHRNQLLQNALREMLQKKQAQQQNRQRTFETHSEYVLNRDQVHYCQNYFEEKG